MIKFDPKKNQRNIDERDLPFTRADEFDFDSALIMMNTSRGEPRYVAVGYLDDRLHVLCYTMRGEDMRVFSFRKANRQEGKRYGKAITR